MNVQKLGQVVADRRKELGFSQDDLAQKAGISRAYISLIERAEATNISTKILDNLAITLGVPITKLLGQPEHSELLIPPALREFALTEKLNLETVDKLARLPRRGKEPQTAKDWKKLYEAIKFYLG